MKNKQETKTVEKTEQESEVTLVFNAGVELGLNTILPGLIMGGCIWFIKKYI